MSPIVSPRPRERSHPPVLRVLTHQDEPRVPPADDLDMSERRDVSERREPTLRIVPGDGREAAPVLLAGADAHRRGMLRAEFGATLPPRTTFSEADDVTEVLERAPSSRMVILAGDLDDADAESLMRMLGRRHPRLPVICVDAPMPTAAGGRG